MAASLERVTVLDRWNNIVRAQGTVRVVTGALIWITMSIACWGGVEPQAQPQSPVRPHLLFILADDWGRHAGCYARADGPGTLNDLAHTPHIDALASRGVLFRNAFVNAPSCTPCRSSLLTGQYFWRTGRGAILHGARWDESIPAFPLLLRDAGFTIGKAHKVWSPGEPADAPFGGQSYAFEAAGRRMNQFSQHATQMVERGVPVADAKAAILAEVRRNFASFLDAREDDAPFHFWFGPTNTHRKWVAGSGQQLWGLDPDALQGKLPRFLPDVPVVRQDLADYLGEIAALDAAVGELVSELRQRELLEQTMIVISGDHGAPGFPHGKCNLYDFGTRVPLIAAGPGVPGGRVVDDLVCLTDLAPTFLELAGVAQPDVMTGRSLMPLLANSASGQIDPARTWVITGRERHVEMARAGYLPYPQRCLRTHEFAFIINFRPERYPLGDPFRLEEQPGPTFAEVAETTYVTLPDEDAGPTKAWLVEHRHDPEITASFTHAYGLRPREELYDLRRDPDQMQNVASDPAYESVCARMREQLLSELRRSGDPRVMDDEPHFERPPFAGPLPDDVPHPNRGRGAP